MERKLILVVLAVTLVTIFSGCSSTPDVGDLEYQNKQVFMCRKLCANAEVSIAEIQGLECVCNTRVNQTPVPINNVFYGPTSSAPSAYAAPSYNNAPTTTNTSSPSYTEAPRYIKPQAKPPSIKRNAAVVDVNGRRIISQTKYSSSPKGANIASNALEGATEDVLEGAAEDALEDEIKKPLEKKLNKKKSNSRIKRLAKGIK